MSNFYELSRENFTNLLDILYCSPDAQSHHNTSGLDKYDKNVIQKKLEEMIICNDHNPCKILTQLMKNRDD